jgi:hypothetical protein
MNALRVRDPRRDSVVGDVVGLPEAREIGRVYREAGIGETLYVVAPLGRDARAGQLPVEHEERRPRARLPEVRPDARDADEVLIHRFTACHNVIYAARLAKLNAGRPARWQGK